MRKARQAKSGYMKNVRRIKKSMSQQAELLSPTTEAIMQEISALQMQQTETQITLEMLMEQ